MQKLLLNIPQITTEYALEYNINSHKAIRSGINRHLHDLWSDFDIVRGREGSNAILDSKLKKNLKQGLTKPIKHKEIISKSDLEK